MVLTLTHNKENTLPSRAKRVKPTTTPRKPRSRSHIPLPTTTSTTPSPVNLNPRKQQHVKSNNESTTLVMDVDISDSLHSKRAIQLPRSLKKPTTMPVLNMAALTALDPELANVPLDYTIDKLRIMGKGMLQVACSSTAQPASNHLPRELQVLIHDTTFPPPTHVFAVYSRTPNDNHPQKVTLHPAHGIILAAHCANLPPLPPYPSASSESGSESESNSNSDSDSIPTPTPTSTLTRTLPIIPLSLPSPNTFPLLLAYLYTKQPQALFSALLPPTQPSLTLSNPNPNPPTPTSPSDPTSASTSTFTSTQFQSSLQTQTQTQTPTHLACTLAQTYTTQALLAHAARVHGLWANIVALGVGDEVVWKVVHVVWAVLIAALENAVLVQ